MTDNPNITVQSPECVTTNANNVITIYMHVKISVNIGSASGLPTPIPSSSSSPLLALQGLWKLGRHDLFPC